jgi:hypothetical protein
MRRPLTQAWSKLIKNNAISVLINKLNAVSSEEIWYKLNDIAYKLYHLNLDFNQLTAQELQFWRQFKQEDIFEWLSGSAIHTQDYNEYIRIRSTINHEPQVQLQAPAPQQQQVPPQQLGVAAPNPVPAPSPQNQADCQDLKTNRRTL